MHQMTRYEDHATSIEAAAKVKVGTLRDKVIAFAIANPAGFTDAMLGTEFPGSPESSLRKRRSELTQDGVILDTGMTAMNAHGNTVVIWQHRDFSNAPKVYAGQGAINPVSAYGLDQAIKLAEKRKARALTKYENAKDELAAADAAFVEAIEARKAFGEACDG